MLQHKNSNIMPHEKIARQILLGQQTSCLRWRLTCSTRSQYKKSRSTWHEIAGQLTKPFLDDSKQPAWEHECRIKTLLVYIAVQAKMCDCTTFCMLSYLYRWIKMCRSIAVESELARGGFLDWRTIIECSVDEIIYFMLLNCYQPFMELGIISPALHSIMFF